LGGFGALGCGALAALAGFAFAEPLDPFALVVAFVRGAFFTLPGAAFDPEEVAL
jgi:hypothetical protein